MFAMVFSLLLLPLLYCAFFRWARAIICHHRRRRRRHRRLCHQHQQQQALSVNSLTHSLSSQCFLTTTAAKVAPMLVRKCESERRRRRRREREGEREGSCEVHQTLPVQSGSRRNSALQNSARIVLAIVCTQQESQLRA